MSRPVGISNAGNVMKNRHCRSPGGSSPQRGRNRSAQGEALRKQAYGGSTPGKGKTGDPGNHARCDVLSEEPAQTGKHWRLSRLGWRSHPHRDSRRWARDFGRRAAGTAALYTEPAQQIEAQKARAMVCRSPLATSRRTVAPWPWRVSRMKGLW